LYRFAPSPTGDMHIGNLRAAIFNYICSLQDQSGFILRIEDTDTARNIEGKDQEIIEILKRFGISWQSLYYQSKNLKFHQQFAAKLLAEKKAFCCFCSEEELEAKKQAAKDSDLWLRYTERAKELKLSPHNLALADFLLPPKIDRVNTKGYDGRVGSKLFIIASDNFQITSVSVRINKDDGNLLEEGNAVLEGLQWVYPITVANAALSDTKLTVSVTDTPGNVTEKEIIL